MDKNALSLFLLLAPLAFCALTACAADDQASAGTSTRAPASASAPAAGQGDTLARIRALAGTPTCSADSQCKTLALGARPCGGPESYLAYSTARTPEAELRALGDVYQAERRAANTSSGMMSDCRLQPDPGAVCQAGACTLGAAGPMAR
jgi:hypothetical protein